MKEQQRQGVCYSVNVGRRPCMGADGSKGRDMKSLEVQKSM